MNFSFMRFLDRYFGAFLLFFLYALRKVGFPWRRQIRLADWEHPRTILIQKYFGIGSIVNAIPLINVLRGHFQNVRIVFVTFKANVKFLEIVGITDQQIVIDEKNILTFAVTTLRALLAMNREKPDVCIDLEFFSKFSMITSFLSGAPIRVGFFAHFNIRSSLLTHPTSFNHYKHISRAYLSMAEALTLKVPDTEYGITLPASTPGERSLLWQRLGLPDETPILCINPNASSLCELRKWPADRYVELTNALLERYPDFVLALIGSKSEAEYVDIIFARCNQGTGRLLNVAGRTSLKELMVLLESCTALVSNDSGPVHIAAGYATPTVAIYGPETPVLYGPYNVNAVSLFASLYCSPCINVLDNKKYTDCSEVLCMRSITVDAVLESLDSLFSRPGGQHQ